MKKIEMGKKYRTRDGRSVRLLCVDAVRNSPVVGLVPNTETGGEWIGDWTNSGSYLSEGRGEHEYDLVEIPPYADIPIDTPGWARGAFGWRPRHFAGIDSAGKPLTWAEGTTSFTSGCFKTTWYEFTTTKPEGVE